MDYCSGSKNRTELIGLVTPWSIFDTLKSSSCNMRKPKAKSTIQPTHLKQGLVCSRSLVLIIVRAGFVGWTGTFRGAKRHQTNFYPWLWLYPTEFLIVSRTWVFPQYRRDDLWTSGIRLASRPGCNDRGNASFWECIKRRLDLGS